VERAGRRVPQPQRLLLALFVSFVLVPGCGEPARKASHNLGPRFTPRVLCQDGPSSDSPAYQDTCSHHGGVWEGLGARRP
jgi:hypothetical protein